MCVRYTAVTVTVEVLTKLVRFHVPQWPFQWDPDFYPTAKLTIKRIPPAQINPTRSHEEGVLVAVFDDDDGIAHQRRNVSP